MDKSLIGMLHVPASPGAPAGDAGIGRAIDQTAREAELLLRAGFDAVLIENMHDRPYLRGTVGPEVTAFMAVVGKEVRNVTGLPTGVQILAGANREAMAVALAAGLDFVRAEGFVFAHVGDEGIHDASAADLLRYRKQIGADRIAVFADVKKKHSSHAITSDVSLGETVRAAEFFLADGVIVSGAATGQPVEAADLAEARQAVSKIPLIVGSGATATNAAGLLTAADALIVGSAIKVGGTWDQPVCPDTAAAFVEAARRV